MKITGFGDWNWEADGYWAGLPTDYVPSVQVTPQVIARAGAIATFGPSTIGEHVVPVEFGYRGALSYEQAWSTLLQRLRPADGTPRELRGSRNDGTPVTITAVMSMPPAGSGEVNTLQATFTAVEPFWRSATFRSVSESFTGTDVLSIGNSTVTLFEGAYGSGPADDPGFQPAPLTLKVTPTAQRPQTGDPQATLARTTVGTEAVRLAAAAADRTGLTVQPLDGAIWIGPDAGVSSGNGFPVASGERITLEHTGEVWAVAAADVAVAAIDDRDPRTVVGWRYRRIYRIVNGTAETLASYPWAIDLGMTDGLVAAGKAQADGDDVRVVIEGIERPRTLVDFGSAARTALCWIVLPAVAAGGSLEVEVWYGNPSARPATALDRRTGPAFDVLTAGSGRSTNQRWVYRVDATLANAGLGGWWIDGGGDVPGLREFSAPGAWRPVRTVSGPDSAAQPSYASYTASSTTCFIARFEATRARNGVTLDAADGDGFDGVALGSPARITGVTFDLVYVNDSVSAVDATPLGQVVLLKRDSNGDDWRTVWSQNTTAATETTVAERTESFAAVRSVAFAVWPYEGREIEPGAGYDRVTFARWKSKLEVALDASEIVTALAQDEEEIYEISAEVRAGGGASGDAAPFTAIRLGHRASGDGRTTRYAIRLDETLAVDMAKRRAVRYADDGRTRIGDVPYAALSAVEGVLADGALAERPATGWLNVNPSVNLVPNPSFTTDASGWQAGTVTSGVTAALARDTDQFASTPASGRLTVSASTAGTGAVAERLASTLFPVNGRTSVQVAASLRTGTALLRPLLAIAWYDADGTLLETAVEPAWDAPVNTWRRRVHAAVTPEDAASYRVGFRAVATGAGATGSVWIDDVSLNGNDLVWDEDSPGTVTVAASWLPRYR